MEEYVGVTLKRVYDPDTYKPTPPEHIISLYCDTSRVNGWYYYSPVTGEWRGWYRDSGDAMNWWLRELGWLVKSEYVKYKREP